MRCLFVLTFCVLNAIHAEDALPQPKPVPLLQALPQPHDQVSFQRDGVELSRLHFGADGVRPFVFPLNGPSGRSLTRMGHPQDPVGHSHHNSVWIAHQNAGGANFWEDRGKCRIVTQRLEKLLDGDDNCGALLANAWTNGDGKVLMHERRLVSIHQLPDKEYFLLLDLQLEPAEQELTLDKTPMGMIGVRMAKTIGVNDGGGTIRNSEGQVNEKEVFRKPARWVDYSGPITATAIEGVTLLDHPNNPSHPSPFHVRNDGWMGICLTFNGAIKIEAGKPLKLRYGLYVHAGKPEVSALQQRWEEFAKLPLPDLSPPKKK